MNIRKFSESGGYSCAEEINPLGYDGCISIGYCFFIAHCQKSRIILDINIDYTDTNKPLTVITDKDLCVCVEQRVLQVSGIEITLTRQEFDALYLLPANRKWVMTFEMGLIFVWSHEYADVSSKVVSNLMSRVRQELKIEANTQGYIKSIHGMGYKFDP